MCLGVILFSCSIYAWVFGGSEAFILVTPFGGFAFIFAWSLLVIHQFFSLKSRNENTTPVSMNKALIAFLWIATAVLSYWLGSGKGSDSDNHKSENQSLTSNSVSIEDKAEEKHHPKSKVSSLMTAVDESIDSGVMVTQPQLEEKIVANAESDFPSLEERIQSSNMITRLRAFTELLEEGSSQSIEQAREIYEKLPAGPQRYSELRLLAYGWGQKDPESALGGHWTRRYRSTHWNRNGAGFLGTV